MTFHLESSNNSGGGGVISFRLVNETRTIVLVQAGTQANQFGIAINYTGNITNFTGN